MRMSINNMVGTAETQKENTEVQDFQGKCNTLRNK